MTQETTVMPNPDKQTNQKNASNKDNEIDEIEEELAELDVNKGKGLFQNIQMVFEKLACTRMGQMVYEQCDRLLKVVEDTAKWGLPQDDDDAKLERPLPWVLFLTLIIWLRIFYFWFNIGSAIVGTSRISAHSMVCSVQMKRRRLRAIRMRGLRTMRGPEPDVMATSDGSINPPSLMFKLRQLLGSAVCRPGQSRDTLPPSSQISSPKRPREDECFDLNLTVDQMLDKYANEGSEDDSDYVPNIEEDDERSISTSSMSSDEEADAKSTEKDLSDSNDSALNTTESVDHTLIEANENGALDHHQPMPKPIPDIKLETVSDADSGNEQLKTSQDAEYSEHFNSHHAEMHNAEVAPPQEQLTTSSPIHQQQHNLTFNLDEEAQKKSIRGHQTAASIKHNHGASSAEAPKLNASSSRNNCCRTITTETCIEYDWSIIVKTEITHRRQPNKLPKLNCTIQTLTPASSTEDIFYSPIGSPTELQTIFHPAPLIKTHSTEVPATNKDNVGNSGNAPANEMPELQEPYQQRKQTFLNRNKQQQYQHNFHNKHRNKNRR